MHEEKEENGGHIVALLDSNGVWDAAFLFPDLELNGDVGVQGANDGDERRRGAIVSEEGEKEVVVRGVECFDKVDEKPPSGEVVIATGLKGGTNNEESILGAATRLGSVLSVDTVCLDDF